MARPDRGAALLFVIGIGVVMMLLITTGITVAKSGMQQANTTRSTTSALDAAYAGVEDYLAHVNVESSYVNYGNPASKFTKATSSDVTLDADNHAFDDDASGSWATVPGSGGFAKFRYEVDNSNYAANGVIRLQVTGMAGDRTKTILANLRVRGFSDYSYFTDYEIQDPLISGAPESCILHAWEGRPQRCGGVPDTRFLPSDRISGDVHSNDTLNICSAQFTGNVTTANTASPLYNDLGCSRNPPVNITRAPDLPMPETNSSMKTDAECLYTGPTTILYNSDGTMTVTSPWTKDVGENGSTAACGDPNVLQTGESVTVPQLNNDLLFVQNVPQVASDPNYWDPDTTPAGVTCLDADGNASTAANGPGWALGSGTAIRGTTTSSGDTSAATPSVRYPRLDESPASGWASSSDATQWNTTTPAYGCRNGDLYVSGTVTSRTTAASENYVYVTDDITYSDQQKNVLGLVGQNAVLVYNPMTQDTADGSDAPMLADSSPSSAGRTIQAAILSVAHTFQVQNFDRGEPRGDLKLFGSIAQKFRGPVSASDPDTGYTKAYTYDPLLKTVSPPKFLAPSATSFTVTRYASVPIAFDSTGAAQ